MMQPCNIGLEVTSVKILADRVLLFFFAYQEAMGQFYL